MIERLQWLADRGTLIIEHLYSARDDAPHEEWRVFFEPGGSRGHRLTSFNEDLGSALWFMIKTAKAFESKGKP